MAKVVYEIDILGERRVISSLQAISDVQSEINTKFKTAQFGSATYDSLVKTQAQLNEVKNQVNSYNQSLGSMTRTGSQAGIALQNLNFVIRDSPYFLKDMQLGVLAVGNNINPLIDSFIRLRLEAARLSKTTGETVTTMSLLKRSLVGGVGLSVLFSVVVTAIQAFVFAQRDAKDATDKLNESLETQYDKLEKMARSQLLQRRVEALMEITREEEALLGKLTFRAEVFAEYGRQGTLDIMLQGNPDIAARISALREEIAFIDIRLTGATNIQKIENEITLLKEKQKTETNPAIVKQYEDSIEKLEKMIKSWKGIEEKTKKVKAVLTATPPLLAQIVEAMARYNAQMAILGLGGGRAGTGGGGLRPGGLRPTINPMEDLIEKIDKDLKPLLRQIGSIADVLGNSIANAFLTGKNAIDAATQALAQFIVQLGTVQLFKGLIYEILAPGSFMFGFLQFAQGGIVPKANQGMVVPGSYYSGDRVLVGANSGEMILNKRQQAQLFSMLNNGGGGGTQVIRVEGELKADGNKFYSGFQKTANIYKKNVKGKAIGRRS